MIVRCVVVGGPRTHQGGPIRGVEPARGLTILLDGYGIIAANKVILRLRVHILQHHVIQLTARERVFALLYRNLRQQLLFRLLLSVHQFRLVMRHRQRFRFQIGPVLGGSIVRQHCDLNVSAGTAGISRSGRPIEPQKRKLPAFCGAEAIGHDCELGFSCADHCVAQRSLREHSWAIQTGHFLRIETIALLRDGNKAVMAGRCLAGGWLSSCTGRFGC